MQISSYSYICLFLSTLLFVSDVKGALKRCYKCRSRGGLGDCKDPFSPPSTGNLANTQANEGVEAIPCSTGWCVKYIEGNGNFNSDDHNMATERNCLQRPPSDNQERCAKTLRRNQEVYVCFCNGDLCNGSTRLSLQHPLTLLSALLVIRQLF